MENVTPEKEVVDELGFSIWLFIVITVLLNEQGWQTTSAAMVILPPVNVQFAHVPFAFSVRVTPEEIVKVQLVQAAE